MMVLLSLKPDGLMVMTAKTALKTDNKKAYVSKPVDKFGYVNYTQEENKTWEELYNRQIKIIQNRACNEFIQGLESLAISSSQIPQLPEINKKLKQVTGWQVTAVPALIGFKEFFQLLAKIWITCKNQTFFMKFLAIVHF